jgi:eukaryotic-like serine/threonine-protein kinase
LPYRIAEKLGQGGMGVVYRAEDLRLGRQVALKFLPQEHTGPSPELRRFEQEARAASALSHPNICTIYGLEEVDGRPAIVMELVEGETLAARLARGRLVRDEALRYAVQIAAALTEAHRKGIVHRDLKPANIMLAKTGVKVLDFGLARIDCVAAAAGEETVTASGTVLGTASYMSPEQAQGSPTDARSDLFSLGVVLYEMLASKRPFEGANSASVIAALLEREPAPLGEEVPERVRRVVGRCLAKNPDERWQSALDLKAELEWISEGPEERRPGTDSRAPIGRKGWLAAAGLAILVAGAAVLLWRPSSAEAPFTRFALMPPEGGVFGGSPTPAASPDGRRVVFSAYSKDGAQLWIRSLDSMTAVPIPGSGSVGVHLPFWSPTGQSLAFFSDGKLKRIDFSSSGPAPPVTICEYTQVQGGGTWNRDGLILFSAGGVLYRVPETGGTPAPLFPAEKLPRGRLWVSPWFLPDNRHFLFEEIALPLPPAEVTIRAGMLDSGETTLVRKASTNAIYTQHHILFAEGTTLMAQRFRPDRLAIDGEASSVAANLLPAKGAIWIGLFSASENGLLVYAEGKEPPFEVSWYDRHGNRLSSVTEAEMFADGTLELSPDQQRFSWAVEEQKNQDIWLFDVARSVRTRLTFDPASEVAAVWTPDSRTIVFSSNRNGHIDLYRRPSDLSGPEELLYADETDKYPTSVSPDGGILLYDSINSTTRRAEARFLELGTTHASRSQPAIMPTANNGIAGSATSGRFHARFSPDGRWIAYHSIESGRPEVYVIPFHNVREMPGGNRQISTAGGAYPRWTKDGKELVYYQSTGRAFMAVPIDLSDRSLRLGEPQQLFSGISSFGYDVSADGQRLLVVARKPQAGVQPLTAVLNWRPSVR